MLCVRDLGKGNDYFNVKKLYLGKMVKTSKIKTSFTLIFWGLSICSYAQELTISAKTDTSKNQITTFVSLINIPDGVRARFQQRLPLQAKVISLPLPSEYLLWDTAKNSLTIITPHYPRIDTLNFSFICHVDTLPNVISWGEAALMYENKNKEVKKIALPAKIHPVRQPNSLETDSAFLKKKQ